MENKQNRFRSRIAWTATGALVLFVLKNYGLLTPIGLTPDSYKELFELTMVAFGAFGFFNDPTSKDSF